MIDFCETHGAVFAVLSKKGRDCTKVRFVPVRSRLMRKAVSFLLSKREGRW